MRIAVTGANGFIGKSLCEALSVAGHEMLPLFRGYDTARIRDFYPEWIFHSAAEIYKEDEMFVSNVVLTHELIEATRDIGYKAFVYIGTSSEYGRKKSPMRESDCLSPTTMYEATKACGSLLCQSFARAHNKPIVIARPFSVYGAYEPSYRLIPRLLTAAKTGDSILLSHAVHDFIYINDLVRALILIAENPVPGEIVNIGTGTMTSNVAVAQTIEQVLGKHIQYDITLEKLRAFDSAYWCCNPQHASAMYKFDAKYSLYEGLRDYAK